HAHRLEPDDRREEITEADGDADDRSQAERQSVLTHPGSEARPTATAPREGYAPASATAPRRAAVVRARRSAMLGRAAGPACSGRLLGAVASAARSAPQRQGRATKC